MGAYKQLKEIVKPIAERINPGGVFYSGSLVDSYTKHGEAGTAIHLYTPVSSVKPKTYQIKANFGFLKPDDNGNTVDQRESLIDDMEDLAERFIEELQLERLEVVNEPQTEPQHQTFPNNYSGVFVHLVISLPRKC